MISEYIGKAKEWALEQVMWAERELKGRSGTEKRNAVIAKLDDMITLPAWLEWADGPIIAALVDAACGLLNDKYGHAWGAAVFHKKEIEEAAKAMPDPAGGETAHPCAAAGASASCASEDGEA